MSAVVRRTRKAPLPWPGFVAAWRAGSAVAVVLLAAGLSLGATFGGVDHIVLATTTSTRDSGLLDYLLPTFFRDSGVDVRYVAVGTGQSLDMGRRGDADVVLVHAPSAELVFMAQGEGFCRSRVMYNEFILVGPPEDPARVRGLTNGTEAFRRIMEAGTLFISRGDNSGTNIQERVIWFWIGHQPSSLDDSWYKESGQGMGATLEMASQLGGYTLSDDGTYFARAASLRLEIDVQHDPPLRNWYSVIPVSPDRHPNVNVRAAVVFAKWLTSEEGQALIRAYTIGGRPAFTPAGEDHC